MKTVPLILLLALFLQDPSAAAEPPAQPDLATCKDNAALDAYLRKVSPLYNAMSRLVEFHGGYTIGDREGVSGGLWNAVDRTIHVNPQLAGAHRASIIAFEMTNAYQDRLHREVDMAVVSGEITTKTEFALRQELIEYDGLRLHREILLEIENQLGKLPPEFFFVSHPKPESVARYQLPLVMDFLKQMSASGHTAFYYQWFEMQKKPAPKPGK
jgi:hypothetical protein